MREMNLVLIFPLDLPSFAISAALREMLFLLVCFSERKGLYPVWQNILEGMMNTILYFAYGSNMSTRRLVARVPSAKAVSVAMLSGHSLEFHKIGKDGSAKCDAVYTDDLNDVVHGVVFEMALSEKPTLDKIEGLGNGYAEKDVIVLSESGEAFEAVTYYATSIDASLEPCDWYVEHVLRGAREHGLPPDYINRIEAIESIPDPDNYEVEMAIYQ